MLTYLFKLFGLLKQAKKETKIEDSKNIEKCFYFLPKCTKKEKKT